MNKKYLSFLFEAIKQTSGLVEKDKNQPLLQGIKREMTIKSGYHDLYSELKKNNIDILKNLNRGKVERQQALDKLNNEQSLFPELQKKRTAELQTDLKQILNGIEAIETETEYRDNLRMVLNRFFTTGKGMAKRYILLPLSSNFNVYEINTINNSLDRQEGLLSKMSDFNDTVKDQRADTELINYLISCGYNIDQDEFYKGFCRNDKNVKLKIVDELEKIKKINLSDKKSFLKRLKTDDPLYMNVQQQITNRERFKESYLERMTIILSDSHQTKTDDTEVVIITWIPRLIMSQSTSTIWTSCMELFSDITSGGSNQHFVMSGIKSGVFIAWLVNLKDMKTINKPIARMLIKPFYSEADDEIIFWPSDLYHDGGTSNLNLFVKTVNRFCYLKQRDRINFDRNVKVNIMQPDQVYSDSGDRNKIIYSFQNLIDGLLDNIEYEKENGYQTYVTLIDENDKEISLSIDIDKADEDHFFQILMNSNGYTDKDFLSFLRDQNDKFLKRHGYLIFAAALENSKYAIIDFILKESKKDLDRYFYKSFLKFSLTMEKRKTISYNLVVFLFNNYIFKYKLYEGEYAYDYRKMFNSFLADKRFDVVGFLIKHEEFFLNYINTFGFLFLDLFDDQNLRRTVLDFLINKKNLRDIISFKIKRKKAGYYADDLYHLSCFKYKINDKTKIAKIDEVFFQKEDSVNFKKSFINALYTNKMSDVSYRDTFNEKLFMQALKYFTELEGKISEDDFKDLRRDLATVLSYDNVKKYLSEEQKKIILTELLHLDKLVKMKDDINDSNNHMFYSTNKQMYNLDFAIDKYLDFLVEKKFYLGLCAFIEMTLEEFRDYSRFFSLAKQYTRYMPKGNFKLKSRTANFLFSFLENIFPNQTRIDENVSQKTLKDILSFMDNNGFVLDGEEQYFELAKLIMSGDLDEVNKKYSKIYFIIDFIFEQMKKNNIKITEINSYFLTKIMSHRLTESNKKMYDYFGKLVELIGPELFFKNTIRWINDITSYYTLSVLGNEFYFRKLLEYNPKFFEDKKNIEIITKKILEITMPPYDNSFVINQISPFLANSFIDLIKKGEEFSQTRYKNFYKFVDKFPDMIQDVNQKNLADSALMQIFYHVIKKEKFTDYDTNEIAKPLIKILISKNLLNENNLDQIYEQIGNAYVYLLDSHFEERFFLKNFKLRMSNSVQIEDTSNNMIVLRIYMEEELPISMIRQPMLHMKKLLEMFLEIIPSLDETDKKYIRVAKDKRALNEIIRNILLCITVLIYAITDNKNSVATKDEFKMEFMKIANAIKDKNLELSSKNIDTINEMKWKLTK